MQKTKKKSQKPTRLLTREGDLNVHKETLSSFAVYNYLLGISWQRFLGYAFAAYISINIIFTFFYFFLADASCLTRLDAQSMGTNVSKTSILLDIFFFSTQTFTTVGYGHIHPKCVTGNIIASCESFTGLIFFAVVTGLFYAKFTKPRVRVKLSDVAVLDYFSLGGYALKIMLGNEYNNKLVDLEVTLDLIRLEVVDGRYKKRFFQLPLLRKRIPMLSVPWTVVHIIDEKSPLYGISKEDFENSKSELFVQVKAFDEAHGQLMYNEFSYFGAEEIRWGEKFVNIQRYTETGSLKISMKRFGKTTPISDFPNTIPPPQYYE